MTNEIVVKEMPEIQNKELKKYTNRIQRLGMNIRSNMLAIAYTIAQIDASGCYADDGFESVHEYTAAVCGIKRAQSYAMLSVGRDYLTQVNSKSFAVETILDHTSGKDYSLSQVQALLPLKDANKAVELSVNGVISSDMSVKQIKDIVKEIRGVGKSEDGEDGEETEEPGVGDTLTKATEETTYTIEHEVKLGHYMNGTIYISVDGKEYDNEVVFNDITDLLARFLWVG